MKVETMTNTSEFGEIKKRVCIAFAVLPLFSNSLNAAEGIYDLSLAELSKLTARAASLTDISFAETPAAITHISSRDINNGCGTKYE